MMFNMKKIIMSQKYAAVGIQRCYSNFITLKLFVTVTLDH